MKYFLQDFNAWQQATAAAERAEETLRLGMAAVASGRRCAPLEDDVSNALMLRAMATELMQSTLASAERVRALTSAGR